jgi:GNAT superfamily N-acetyltransferase
MGRGEGGSAGLAAATRGLSREELVHVIMLDPTDELLVDPDPEQVLWEELEELGAGEHAFIWFDEDRMCVAVRGGAAELASALEETMWFDGSHVCTPMRVRCGSLGAVAVKDGEVRITQALVSGGFGVDDYEQNDGLPLELTAIDTASGAVIGSLQYLARLGAGRIRYLEVAEEHRRRGIGSALLDALEREHSSSWETNDFSEDGAALVEARQQSA